VAWGGSRTEGPGALFLATCALLLPAAANGQAASAVSPYVEEKVVHDDNVFRLSGGIDPAPAIGSSARGDTYNVTSAGLNLDLPVSRQRLAASLSVNDSRYSRFGALNYTGHDLRATWLWQVGSGASGQLGYSDSSTLASFANLLGTAPDHLTLRQAFATGTFLLTPRWQMQAGLSGMTQRNSDAARRMNDVDIADAEFALRYVTPAEMSLGLSVSAEGGSFPVPQAIAGMQLDNAYRQRRIGLVGEWPVTAASRLSGRIGGVGRRYEQLPQRDFDRATARLQYDWKPTPKTSLTAIAQRDLSPFEYVRSSAVMVRGLTLRPTYNATPKLDISGTFDFVTRDFLGDPAVALGLASARSDRLRSVGVLVSYRASGALTLQLSGVHERRSSNVDFGDYQADVVSLSVRLAF
jgi:exopolysaccharide biosynthesis operon protein EpsL